MEEEYQRKMYSRRAKQWCEEGRVLVIRDDRVMDKWESVYKGRWIMSAGQEQVYAYILHWE